MVLEQLVEQNPKQNSVSKTVAKLLILLSGQALLYLKLFPKVTTPVYIISEAGAVPMS